MTSSILQDLAARGLIADASEGLAGHLEATSRTLYVGFDPTADSLHIGSLLPLLALRRAQLAGHRPIVLVGGGTGLIGDPSGKAGERALNPKEVVHEWADRLKRQVARFVDFECGQLSAVLVDNYEWICELDVVSFLRDVGKYFSVSVMLAKESVKARLPAGISFTEFSYQVLQAYDFLCLRRRYNCTVQMGGSDQWGNITAGIDLIRRLEGRPAFGLTLPLVTKGDGGKFGKTESGTVWLDTARTSAYEMYQFWLNTADGDVVRFLKFFTFLPPAEIEDLGRRTAEQAEKREAQLVLAREATRLVHGPAGLREADHITGALFTGDVQLLTESELRQALAGVPRTVLESGEPQLLVDVLVQSGLAESRRRARDLITAGAITQNGLRVTDPGTRVSSETALFGAYFVLRKGKKTYHLVALSSGSDRPGSAGI